MPVQSTDSNPRTCTPVVFCLDDYRVPDADGQKCADCYDNTKRSDQDRFAHYFRNMLNRGIYVSPSQFEGNFISETHTPEILDYVLQSIAESIPRN